MAVAEEEAFFRAGEGLGGLWMPSAWSALKTKNLNSKCSKCSNLSFSLSLSLCDYLCSLYPEELPGWLCSEFVPDIHHCHLAWEDNVFLHRLCSRAHITHLYKGERGGWCFMGRMEGWRVVCLWGGRGGVIFEFSHCFQQFLLAWYKWHLMDVPSLSQPVPLLIRG